MHLHNQIAPTVGEIEEMARMAIEELPTNFKCFAEKIVLTVKDFADDTLLAELEIEDPFSLTGLYDGVPLTEKSVSDQPIQPDAIWLFRRPILEEWITRGDVTLPDLVAHVLVHELAHHFGWSDADISKIDRWWE